MKNLLLLLTFSLVSSLGMAQKIKIKNDIASVDGEEYVQIARGATTVELSIRALNADQEEIAAIYRNYKDPNRVTSGNPEGYVRWIELYFPGSDQRCEIPTSSKKGLIKFLIQNDVYVDGKINQESVDRIVKKYGMHFSENRPGGVNVIINN